MTVRSLIRNEEAAAASEFILALPMILPLIFISMEGGNFLWSEQKLVQAVREGTRYAARLDYDKYCPSMDATTQSAIKNFTRTGRLDGNSYSKVVGWSNSQITVSVICDSFVDTGMYKELDGGGKGAVVAIAASVPYSSLMGNLGFEIGKFKLAAEGYSPVIGI